MFKQKFVVICLIVFLARCSYVVESYIMANQDDIQEVEGIIVFHRRKQHQPGQHAEDLIRIFQKVDLLSNAPSKHDLLPGPEWRFVPEYLGAAFPGKSVLRWQAPCFASDSLYVSESNRIIRIVLNTAERKEKLGCGDAYLVASAGAYYVLEPHIGGSYVIEWEGLEPVRFLRILRLEQLNACSWH